MATGRHFKTSALFRSIGKNKVYNLHVVADTVSKKLAGLLKIERYNSAELNKSNLYQLWLFSW